MRNQYHGQRKSLTMWLNLRPVKRIELYTNVCTGYCALYQKVFHDAVAVVDALCELTLRFRSHRHLSVKVYSHLASKLTFASAFASNFNIVSMVMLTLMQRMCTEPILWNCALLPLLPLFSKTQIQTLTLSVNEPLALEVIAEGPFALDDNDVFFCHFFLSSCVNSNIGNHATHFWRHKNFFWRHEKFVSSSPSANGPSTICMKFMTKSQIVPQPLPIAC